MCSIHKLLTVGPVLRRLAGRNTNSLGRVASIDDLIGTHSEFAGSGPRKSTHMAGILVVDDHPTARRAVCTLLSEHDVYVCGEAMDGEEALLKVRKLKPDIVLLDINMPGMNGIQAAYEIRRIVSSTKVIFLTIHDAPETAAVMGILADEFVPKSAVGTRLIPMVKRFLQHQAESARD